MTAPTISELTQLTYELIQVDWSTTGSDPDTGWKVTRNVNAAGAVTVVANLLSELRSFCDDVSQLGLDPGDSLSYIVTDNDGPDASGAEAVVFSELAILDPGSPILEASTVRYATLAAVKVRLGITDASKDTPLTQAIVAAEAALDQHLGRSFPNQQVTTVPVAVTQAAENVSVAVWRAAQAPFGSVGADEFIFGALEVSEVARAELQRTPLLRGLRVSWGIA